MFAKIEISGVIEANTGIHIGESSAFAAIGAVDSPVIRDVRTGLPMIPGSSLKGKMRTLLAKEYNEKIAGKPDEDNAVILRLFGSAKKGATKPSRLLFSDMFFENEAELRSHGIQNMTEIKFENCINRVTCVANPRQIERVIRGAEFGLHIIYDVHADREINASEVLEDFGIIAEGLKLLQYDYIGGSGSRGYGKVSFHDLKAETVVGTIDESLIAGCNEALTKVEAK